MSVTLKTPWMLLPIVAFACLLPLSSRGADEEIVADLVTRVLSETRGFPSVSLKPTGSPPTGVEPLENVEGVRYGSRALGPEGTLRFAARFWPEPAWIRVDRDFDGKLDEEEAMHFAGSGTTLTVKVPVEVLLDGVITEVPLHFVHHHNPNSHCLHLTVPVKREGSVILAGRLRPVALFDGDGDLRFDGSTDALLLDVDGDTELDHHAQSRDRVTPGTTFRVGDEGWSVRIREDGRAAFRRVAGDPPPARAVWPKSGTPRAGANAGTEKTPLAQLEKEYQAAAKRDAKLGANRFTERSNVLNRVGRVGSEAAFAFLWRVFDDESDVNLSAAAIRAMGYREYVAHAAKLTNLARRAGATNLKTAAITALHGMDAPGRRALLVELLAKANDDSLFSTTTRYLSYIAVAEDLAMLEELARTETKPTRRRYAYEAATRYRADPPPADLVRAAARAEDPMHRALGLEHVFRLGLSDAREIAVEALTSKEERVLLQVARILGTTDDAASLSALLALESPPAPVATRIVHLLRAVRREETVATFVGALAHRRADVRARAAAVLGGIPFPAAVEALIAQASKEKNPEVLTAILRALGEQESDAATAAILDAADAARKSPDALAAALDALARLGLDHPKVRRFFVKVMKSRNPVDRMLVLDAASSTGDPIAADMLIDALTDKDWRVRLVAAEGLGKVRVKRAVPILIDRLEDEETPRVKLAVEESLFLVTGQGYYDIVKLWRKWWAESGEEFEVPEEIPRRKKDDHGGASVASFYGVPVNSDRMIFVIDQSGSMSSAAGDMTKLERAVDETLKVVKKLRRGARVNVILFETNIHPWQKGLVKLGPGSKSMLENHLRSKRPTGGTNLYDGLEMALLTKDVDTIYLLSDGSPGSGKFVAQADILREVAKLNRTRRIAIHCVAVGFDSQLMKKLAAENSGQYVRR